MIDALGEALRAAGSGSPVAYPLCFAAGVLTSIGPCVAPRYIAVAALVNGSRRPARRTAAFVAGLVGGYVALGLCAASLGRLWASSSALYVGLAAILAASGIVTIVRAGRDGGSHPHDVRHRRPHPSGSVAGGLGGPFLLGASSILVVSPCCTPFVAAIAGFTTLSGHAAAGVMLLAAFACGHAVPLLCAGVLGSRLSALFIRLSASQAPAIVAGSLMLALAAYYGVLA